MDAAGTCDVGSSGSSRTARAMEQEIQWKGHVTLFAGLQGGDDAVSQGLQVTSFNRVAIDGLQGSIHGIQQQNLTWARFEEALKTTYAIEDSKATGRGFEDWVETPSKGLKVLDVFKAFES